MRGTTHFVFCVLCAFPNVSFIYRTLSLLSLTHPLIEWREELPFYMIHFSLFWWYNMLIFIHLNTASLFSVFFIRLHMLHARFIFMAAPLLLQHTATIHNAFMITKTWFLYSWINHINNIWMHCSSFSSPFLWFFILVPYSLIAILAKEMVFVISPRSTLS